MRPPRSRQAGFSLIEILIALGLSSIVAAGLLTLTRSQLLAFQQNEQINRAQQNARAGMSYVENVLRRSCAGVSQGQVRVFLPGLAPLTQPCLRLFDGASEVGGSFSGGAPTTSADAVEVIYGYGSLTANTAPLVPGTPSLDVASTAGFVIGDLVLIADAAMQNGVLFRLTGINPSIGVTPGTLLFAMPGGAIAGAPINLGAGPGLLRVTRARSIALYVATSGDFTDALMLDPDGMIGANHADAEPLVEQAFDFQLALGVDANTDGVLTDLASSTDEWLGNAAGDGALAAPPWNLVGMPQPRQLRIGIMARTTSSFAGAGTTESALENRPAPATASVGQNRRWRPLRMVVAPRAWNLIE